MKKFMYLHLNYRANPGHGPSVLGIVKVIREDYESGSKWIEVKSPIQYDGVYHRKFFTPIEDNKGEL